MDKFKIVTHDGTFHGDEVFGCALMGKFYPVKIEIERSRDPKVIDTADMVLDVGEIYDIKTARLDHHQVSYTGTRSSAGMCVDWLELNKHIDKRIADELRYFYVDEIDAIDTGKWTGVGTSLSRIISSYNCINHDDPSQDTQFSLAVNWVIGRLDQILLAWEVKWKDWDVVNPILDKVSYTTEILELPRHLRWQGPVGKRKLITRVIFPSVDGQGNEEWVIQVPNRPDPDPYDLAPGTALDVQAKHDIDDCFFVHKEGFIGKTRTREAAYELAKIKYEIEYESRGWIALENINPKKRRIDNE